MPAGVEPPAGSGAVILKVSAHLPKLAQAVPFVHSALGPSQFMAKVYSRPWLRTFASAEQRRLAFGLLLSLLLHLLMFSLTFNGQGIGLPGLDFPWQARRVEVPDVRLVLVPVLVPAQVVAAEPMRNAQYEPPDTNPAYMPPNSMVATLAPQMQPEAIASPKAGATKRAPPVAFATPVKVAERREPLGENVLPSSPLPPPLAPEPEAAPPVEVMSVAQSDHARFAVPVEPEAPMPTIAPAPNVPRPQVIVQPAQDAGSSAQQQEVELAQREAEKQAAQRQVQLEANRVAAERQAAERRNSERQEAALKEAAQKEAARQDAARAEAARLEAERQVIARQAAEKQDLARQEAARQSAARAEAARLELARQETARVEAARQEVLRQEAVRLQSARIEAERQEALKQAVARQEAARQVALHAEAARLADAKTDVKPEAKSNPTADAKPEVKTEAKTEEEKREARLRAIGRQLNEEADRRDAAEAAARRSPSASGLRRGRLFGHTDPHAELILYAEAWSRKIQLNMTFDMIREAAKQPHARPLVTVAIRSDGSVESVTFVVSSGVTAIDEAVRRIVQSQTPYQAFPPGLARDYDVVEIRRSWQFDMAIRLY